MSQQYDVDSANLERLKANAKRRMELRNDFLKQQSDPFKHASGEGGYVFDAAIHRFQAMRLSSFEHFKPNFKNVLYGLGLIVIPMGLCMYIVKNDRAKKEQAYRSGQVAYKDRLFKLC